MRRIHKKEKYSEELAFPPSCLLAAMLPDTPGTIVAPGIKIHYIFDLLLLDFGCKPEYRAHPWKGQQSWARGARWLPTDSISLPPAQEWIKSHLPLLNILISIFPHLCTPLHQVATTCQLRRLNQSIRFQNRSSAKRNLRTQVTCCRHPGVVTSLLRSQARMSRVYSEPSWKLWSELYSSSFPSFWTWLTMLSICTFATIAVLDILTRSLFSPAVRTLKW